MLKAFEARASYGCSATAVLQLYMHWGHCV